MANPETVKRLKELAYQQRVRLITLCGSYNGSVHIGGDLSMTDMLIALYHYGMNVDPSDIALPSRDRFVLSKGHAAVCMYIAMSLRGFFNFEEILSTYGKIDSHYGMHPCKVHLPGVESSAGSLGQGLPIAVGMALIARQRKQNYRVFCMMGDGETCEGSDMDAIVDAIDSLPSFDSNRPTVIICDTVKGKGVSFMEKQLNWHAGNLTIEQMNQALEELKIAHACEQ